MNELVSQTEIQLAKQLREADPVFIEILAESGTLPEARERLFQYLNELERQYFNIHSEKYLGEIHIIEKANAKECIRELKNIIRTENEQLTKVSALDLLWKLSKKKERSPEVSRGFLAEFIFLLKGINARSGITNETFHMPSDNRKASVLRSAKLDEYGALMDAYLRKYPDGLDRSIASQRNRNRRSILGYFHGSETDWKDYRWHLKHIIKEIPTLQSLVKLSSDEIEGLLFAERNQIPFQITPYYLSLFDPEGKSPADRAIRAQVLPSLFYAQQVVENRKMSKDMDFMGERSTSPVAGITRRYPRIVILKPVDICPQICVYCQRNWELKPLKEAKPTRSNVEKAIEWIGRNRHISEVLITGGDPLILSDEYLDRILHKLSEFRHIDRIRIGTRVPVTLPFRIGRPFIRILKKYHRPGRREICLITHFEHPAEITTDSVKAISLIKRAGISIYNQQVFTYFNSRRYETSALRIALKRSGVDPYYTFNTKGKEETADFRVPIARIQQERKEEARFLPGLCRTDEPVFNVPKLGKSHLRAWQDHELIMINPAGERIYRFYPWESKVTLVDDYIYTDVPILNYLEKLKNDGENLDDYRSIWYYF
jgi:lysine 2,3-aminomutase